MPTTWAALRAPLNLVKASCIAGVIACLTAACSVPGIPPNAIVQATLDGVFTTAFPWTGTLLTSSAGVVYSLSPEGPSPLRPVGDDSCPEPYMTVRQTVPEVPWFGGTVACGFGADRRRQLFTSNGMSMATIEGPDRPVTDPSWAPTRVRIVATAISREPPLLLFDGVAWTPLHTPAVVRAAQPLWSPNDRFIAFKGNQSMPAPGPDLDSYQVWVVDLEARVQTPLTARDEVIWDMSWSPNGDCIVIATRESIRFLSLDGRILSRLDGRVDGLSWTEIHELQAVRYIKGPATQFLTVPVPAAVQDRC